MFKEPIATASRRLATPSRTTTQGASHSSSLLAALDSLDFNSTEVAVPRSRTATKPRTVEQAAVPGEKKSGVQRLGADNGDTFVHSFLKPQPSRQYVRPTTPEVEPPLKITSKSARNTRTRSSRAAGKQSAVISLGEEEVPSEEALPIYSYKDYGPKPCVVYTRNEEEANDLVDSLKPGTVGLDLEWRVTFFRKYGSNSSVQHERRTAVVQVADGAGLILIIQVNEMRRFPIRLQALIEDAAVPKVGVNILNDGKKLFRDYGILAKNLVELGSVALVVDPAPVAKRKIVSLAKLVEHYCQKTLPKGPERTSDWEKPLNEKQREYAANDAHASLIVYNQLLKLSERNSCPLDGDTQSQYAKDVTWALGTSLLQKPETITQPPQGMRPQYLRAYEYWHQRKLSLEEMCVKLSLKNKGPVPAGENSALKPGTVISYVISALQNEPRLEFQPAKIVELVQMDLNSWSRHYIWIIQQCTTT